LTEKYSQLKEAFDKAYEECYYEVYGEKYKKFEVKSFKFNLHDGEKENNDYRKKLAKKLWFSLNSPDS